MAMVYTSRDAYNGCLSLFSEAERLHRGGQIVMRFSVDGYTGPKMMMGGMAFRDLIRHSKETRELIAEESAKRAPVQLETVSEMVNDPFLCQDYVASHHHLSQFSNRRLSDKISVIEDDRDFELICSLFKGFDENLLGKIWNSQLNWVTCCDILKSLQLSHSGTILTFEFVLDSIEWPPLQRLPVLGLEVVVSASSSRRSSMQEICDSTSSAGSVGGVSAADSWSLCEEDEDEGAEECKNETSSVVSVPSVCSSSSFGVISLSSASEVADWDEIGVSDLEDEQSLSDQDLDLNDHDTTAGNDVIDQVLSEFIESDIADIADRNFSIFGDTNDDDIGQEEVKPKDGSQQVKSYRDVLLSSPPTCSYSHFQLKNPLPVKPKVDSPGGCDGMVRLQWTGGSREVSNDHSKNNKHFSNTVSNYEDDFAFLNEGTYDDFLYEYAGYGNSSALNSRVKLFHKMKKAAQRNKLVHH
mmetsp:Transcript_45273/g.99004  ORF Transcript_45273/g.99004 Transcript_45273/m.99004 type:complete len:469 (+) Transcript_45273:24-1430(+)